MVVLIGGMKRQENTLVLADGVREEFELGRQVGAFLLPIGATGGMAEQIGAELRGSDIVANGPNALRPTDQELEALSNPNATASELVELATQVLRRTQR